MWWEVITEALLDTLKLFPFLFLLYILIEVMEHNTRIGKPNGALTGRAAPLIGTATGLIPMCGFSVMAAKLYEHRHLTLGTLFAVFISTSDEAFFVLLLSELPWLDKLYAFFATCGVKVALGVAIGYLVDFFMKRKGCATRPLVPLEERAHAPHAHGNECGAEHIHAHEHGADHGDECSEPQMHGDEYSACEHRHGKESKLLLYLVSPLLHALKIAAFILAFNLVFGFTFFGIGGGDAEIGEEKVIAFLQGAGYWYQPLVCCLIGLIPNCVSSVALTEAFAMGGVAFGGFLGGLVTNAGLGYLVLFRNMKKWKRTLIIVGFMLLLGIIVGFAGNAVMLCF